jgi:hypothetical protein
MKFISDKMSLKIDNAFRMIIGTTDPLIEEHLISQLEENFALATFQSVPDSHLSVSMHHNLANCASIIDRYTMCLANLPKQFRSSVILLWFLTFYLKNRLLPE